MNFHVITLFPEMVMNLSKYGVVGRAFENKLATLQVLNPRDFSDNTRRKVDDRPYGGGPGMVLMVEPLQKAIQKVRERHPDSRVIHLSAQGQSIQQEDLQRWGEIEHLVLLAGRYEGVDERLIEMEVDEEISIGDIVVSGGELPAILLIDALIRRIPGALGHDESADQDSFVDGMLDCPHYTRPECVNDLRVPEVLMGGDHYAIRRWRDKQSLGRTFKRRPDLFEKLDLSDEQKALLKEHLSEADIQE